MRFLVKSMVDTDNVTDCNRFSRKSLKERLLHIKVPCGYLPQLKASNFYILKYAQLTVAKIVCWLGRLEEETNCSFALFSSNHLQDILHNHQNVHGYSISKLIWPLAVPILIH
ncbi:hypothetical protein NE237_018175 [Protea cynaroides]|uniref:Uncharacterized protein n=1 Tax=Protea cynaroides TaxID=273540 RepID=A0A9Q0K9E0_9MAGN|nr:hypothetical protein NE237_018175 [Protea cynaroides]